MMGGDVRAFGKQASRQSSSRHAESARKTNEGYRKAGGASRSSAAHIETL